MSHATAVEAFPLLSPAQINRATLARQLLLEPAGLDPVAAVGQLAGLQAQEAASPYLALWTRLARFDAADLDAAFRARSVVKASLHRMTLHVVTRDDYLAFLPAVLPMLRRMTRTQRGAAPDDDRRSALLEAGLAHAATPRSNSEIRDHLASLAPEYVDDNAWWWVRRSGPFVHVPAATPWSFGRRANVIDARVWLDGSTFLAEVPALERFVRRYLGALGPATVADLANWSKLPIARLRIGIEAVAASGDLRHFRDEAGRDLLDLDGAPRPEADTPAPPRYLPMWDSLLLGHADRTRVISDAHRAEVIRGNGDTMASFLVDGQVAGRWWTTPDGELDGGQRLPRIVIEPFHRLSAVVERELESEGERLARFVAPLEPAVYSRYRWQLTR